MPYPEQVTADKLLQTGLGVLEREGNLSLQAVARRLGVKAPSLYRHVASLEVLRGKVATEGFRLLGLELQKALVVERTWMSLARVYRRFALRRRALYRLMMSPSGRARRGTDSLQETLRPAAELLGTHTDSKRFLAEHRVAWAFVHGFVDLEMDDAFLGPEGVEEAFRIGVRMIDRTLGRRK